MKLHHTQHAIVSASATTEAAGYPAENVGNGRIRRSWRSMAITQQVLTIDLGANTHIAAVWVQHANVAALTVEGQVDGGGSWDARGTLTLAFEGGTGRRKGYLEHVGTYRYLRLTIAAGTPLDGAAYFEVGAVYIFGGAISLPVHPLLGLRRGYAHAQVSHQLPNGRTVTAFTGADYTVISGELRPAPGEDAEELIRRTRAGVCGLTLEHPERPYLAWPVRHVAESSERTDDVPVDTVPFEVVEEV